MLIIGFLSVAFFVLSATQLTFMPLGHSGVGYVRIYGQPTISTAVQSEKENAPEEEKFDEMQAVKKWDVENNGGRESELLESVTEKSMI